MDINDMSAWEEFDDGEHVVMETGVLGFSRTLRRCFPNQEALEETFCGWEQRLSLGDVPLQDLQ